MQFKPVKSRFQVLAYSYDAETRRSRQVMICSIPMYGADPVKAADLKHVEGEAADAAAVEINAFIDARRAERRASAASRTPRRALDALADLNKLLHDDDTVADEILADLADSLRFATKIVANRSRSLKMKAHKKGGA